jgi:hypothetical protein
LDGSALGRDERAQSDDVERGTQCPSHLAGDGVPARRDVHDDRILITKVIEHRREPPTSVATVSEPGVAVSPIHQQLVQRVEPVTPWEWQL